MFFKKFIFLTTRWLRILNRGRVSKIGFNFQHGGSCNPFGFLKYSRLCIKAIGESEGEEVSKAPPTP